jgi:outer membrane protein TolC
MRVRWLSPPLLRWTLTLSVTCVVAPGILARPLVAQDSLSLTLAEALQRLSTQEPRLAAARAQRDVARALGHEAQSALRNRLLPTVTASYGTQRVAQNQFVEIARRAGIPPTPPDQLDPFSRVFASPNQRTGSLEASIRPFDSGVAAARVAAARAGVEAASAVESQVRAGLELELITRYADVQLQRRLRAVADSALSQAQRTLAVTRQAVAAGRTAEFEVWRVEAEVQALRPAQLEADRQQRLAELGMTQLLGLPANHALHLTSPDEPWSTDAVTMAADTLAQAVAGRDLPRRDAPRLAVRELEAREREALATQRAAWRSLLPALDVTLAHQRLAYPVRADTWGGPYYQNTVVGVSLSVPLDFTGASAARIEAATAAVRAAQAQRRQAEQAHDREAVDVALQRDFARLAWDAARAGAASAEKALRVAEARHETGRASLLELQDARLAWYQAMATRARAARDRLITDARAERLGRLPLTPIAP